MAQSKQKFTKQTNLMAKNGSGLVTFEKGTFYTIKITNQGTVYIVKGKSYLMF